MRNQQHKQKKKTTGPSDKADGLWDSTYTFNMCSPSWKGPPLQENLYSLGATVRHSDTSSLWDASTSQFLIRFSTIRSSEPSLCVARLSGRIISFHLTAHIQRTASYHWHTSASSHDSLEARRVAILPYLWPSRPRRSVMSTFLCFCCFFFFASQQSRKKHTYNRVRVQHIVRVWRLCRSFICFLSINRRLPPKES